MMGVVLQRSGTNQYTVDRTNLLGAVIFGDTELPACPDCGENGYVMSWDGAGTYVCVDCALVVFRPEQRPS